MIVVKEKPVLGLKADIIKEGRIGIIHRELLTRNIFIQIHDRVFYVVVPYKKQISGLYTPHGYKLLEDDVGIAEANMPVRRELGNLIVLWQENKIEIEDQHGEGLLYIDNKKMGSVLVEGFFLKVGRLNVSSDIPVEIQVFCYLTFMKWLKVYRLF